MEAGARSRWPDERLDDLAIRVTKSENNTARLARVEVSTTGHHEDLVALNAKVDRLVDSLEERRDTDAKERKLDRRWFGGTLLTSLGLVVAAVGLLADKL